jgi:hypothetical protein
MRWLIGLATALLATGAPRAWAACDDTDACLRAVERSQRSTRALSARFRQTKHLSLLAEPLVSTGRFAFRQPDQILWQLDEPRLTVRIDRQGIHLPDLPDAAAEVAAVTPFSNVLRELSGVFTGSLSAVRTSFEVRAEGDATAIRVHLVPRSAQWQRMVRSIDVSFAQPDLVVQAMRLDESLGDHLEIVFSDIHRNDTVAEAAIGAGE